MKENPWNKLSENFNINDTFETEIVNIVDFGIFVKVIDEIDGMVHISDLSWDEKECEEIIKKGIVSNHDYEILENYTKKLYK